MTQWSSQLPGAGWERAKLNQREGRLEEGSAPGGEAENVSESAPESNDPSRATEPYMSFHGSVSTQ